MPAAQTPGTPQFDPLPATYPATTGDRSAARRPGRRVGIEIEFGGVSPRDAARCIARTLGGTPERHGPGDWTIDGGALGDVALYLDTSLRPTTDSVLARAGVELGRALVPLEIVTEPLPQSALPAVEALISRLLNAGATGSDAGLLRGYGLHLNVELADPDGGADMPRVALAYCLLEGWLRRRDPLDPSRRALPFSDPLPDALTADLAQAWPILDLPELLGALHRHISSRNYGLDLLPAWAAVRPEDYRRWMPDDDSVSARPAYHYRMPNSRIGRPGWSLAYEWNRWALVETVAADGVRLSKLARAWWDFREMPLIPDRSGWFDCVSEVLGPLAAKAPEGGPDGRPEAG